MADGTRKCPNRGPVSAATRNLPTTAFSTRARRSGVGAVTHSGESVELEFYVDDEGVSVDAA